MDFKIIIKKLNQRLTPDEEIIFNKWYHESEKHKAYFDNVKANQQNNIDTINIEQGWSAIEKKLNAPVKIKFNWKYAIAASIVLFISISFFLITNNKAKNFEPIIVQHNIIIGSDKATLTLEDGSNIDLEKGKTYTFNNLISNGEQLVYNSESEVINPEIAFNYLTVPRGGQFYVKLSDGTQIWLNSDSKLKYPVIFIEGKNRQVELVYGEAYFDVSPSTAHNGSHFEVSTMGQNIDVIGTEFNVKAYKDEQKIYTTLVEGKVAVSKGTNHKELNPGEESILNLENSTIQVSRVDITAKTAWKNGLFIFEKESLSEIMITLSRWYDISVEFENPEKQDILFSGILNRSNDINDLLDSFIKTNEVTFEIKNNRIVVN